MVIASAGFQGDASTLQKLLRARHVMFMHQHNKPMSSTAVAQVRHLLPASVLVMGAPRSIRPVPCFASQMLSNTLYHKRFFPYYTFNLVAGLDEEGCGAVYTYDAIGSYERTGYGCQGSGKDLMQPVLDNQLKASARTGRSASLPAC